MDPIKSYIGKGLLLADPKEEIKLRYKASIYVLEQGVI